MVLLFSSLIMYAAAAQLVAYDMISHGAEGVLIFIAGSVLNLRFLLYSAGIAPHLRSVGLLQRLFGAYALTDQAFGITIVQYHKESEKSCTPFYLGAAATMWIMYQLAAAVGIYLGGNISKEFHLDFAGPLTFSALVVPLFVKSEQISADSASAIIALLFKDSPNNLGFFVATSSGIMAGFTYIYFKTGKSKHV